MRGHKRKVRGISKNFRPERRHCAPPPLANCFRRHCVCRNHRASSIRPVLLPSNMIKSTDYRHRGHRAIYQHKPKVTWIHFTFHSPPLDSYRPVKVRTRLWKIAATLGRYCRTAGRAGPGRAGPRNGLEYAGRAENFWPVHISSERHAQQIATSRSHFCPRDALQSGLCRRAVSVCPLLAGIVYNWLNLS